LPEIDKFFDEAKPPKVTAKEFASGLTAPLGLAIDSKGQIWVTEAGTGIKSDGRVSVITPSGKVHPVITGLPPPSARKELRPASNHLVYHEGVLYILNGVDGKLYQADVTSFKPGDPPISVAELASEDIAKFVLDYKFEVDTEFSNIYNLTFGPDGALYIADAGANAIIRCSKTGQLSVFAAIPGFPTRLPKARPPSTGTHRHCVRRREIPGLYPDRLPLPGRQSPHLRD
jgi:hypothetical protein